MNQAPDPPADTDEAASDLTEQEARDVEEKQSPTVHVLHETIRREGDRELERSASALLWSSIAAGLSMGFSLLAPALMPARIGQTPATPLLVALAYSIGFMLVILGKREQLLGSAVQGRQREHMADGHLGCAGLHAPDHREVHPQSLSGLGLRFPSSHSSRSHPMRHRVAG